MNEHQWERALETGHRNRGIIELAHHHCTRMQFRYSGGHGLAEAESGLPIDMREIYCEVGGHGSMASNLELIAGDYVREHCRDCPSRAPTGRMPNLLTVVDASDATAEQQHQQHKALQEAAALQARRRRAARTALLAANDAGTHQLREDLNIVDSPGHSPDERVAAAHRRLAVAARRAPDLFSGDLVGQLFALVREQHEDRLLTPLRSLVRAGVTRADQVAALACEVLRVRPSSEAAACLVDFPRSYGPQDITREVIMSCVRLVAGPVYTRSGRRQSPRSADPAGLIAVADARLPLALDLVAELLTASVPGRPALVLPAGSAGRTTGAAVQPVREAEVRRHQGAVAARLLLAGGRCRWQDMSGSLREALAQPDADHFDLVPSMEVAAAVAEAMLGEFEVVFADLARVTPRCAEHAERLVKCLDHLRRLLSQDDRFLRRQVAPEVREAVAPMLCQAAVGLLDGRWGQEAGFEVATLVDDLAKQFPEVMAVHAETLLGHMLLLRTPPTPHSALVHPSSATGVPPVLEHLSREHRVQAVLREVRSALARCAGQAPVHVLDAVLAADAATDQYVQAGQRTPEQVRWIRRDCLELACRIAGRYAERPGVVARTLPLLYRRLLGEDTLLRAAAVEGWAGLAQRHQLPGSLADCGPVLMQDPYVAVVRAMLTHGRRLLHDQHMWSLINLAASVATAYQDDAERQDLVALALDVIFYERTRWDAAQVPQVELWILGKAQALSAHRSERLADRAGWSSTTACSEAMAAVRMAALSDPDLNDPFNNHDDLRYVLLMDTAGGGVHVPFSKFQELVSADGLWDAVVLVEVLQRFGRWSQAHALACHVNELLPPVPAYDGHRDLLRPVLDHALSQADPAHRSGHTPVWPLPEHQGDLEDVFVAQRDLAVHARLALRGETAGVIAAPGGTDPAARRVAAASARLEDIACRVEQDHLPSTATAGFLRVWAGSLRVAAYLMRAHEALRRADADQERAHAQAARVRAEELREELEGSDPLHGALAVWLEQVLAGGVRGDRLAGLLADVPVPLRAARGVTARGGVPVPSADAAAEEDLVLVCLLWLDERRVTHGQVVHPARAYTLRVEFRMDAWPDWADRLEVELLSVLSPDELVVPSFSLSRPASPAGGRAEEGEDGVSVGGEGTLVVRFALGAGQPPQAVRVVARFWSQEGRVCAADLAGYPELRLRPFDSTRDALTSLPQMDFRLLTLHERVREFTEDEETLQAFGRLLAAVTAVAAELTYDQLFRRGRYVTEARFHDEVEQRLQQDPLLGGRVARATRQGLGITDVVHDGVTCELKVERSKHFDIDRSRRYLGQPTQYASAVQQQLSILLVLDSTRKTQPVGMQENYLWLMRPELHGAPDAPAPSLVAVVVVNAGLPVPSNWSRRTIAATQIDLANGASSGPV
ncbi:hypothetical protein ABZX65_23565 [Streptomyces sp. NPDC003300]|uniref:hypothetical protein n=1 Tax=unclassified Streptomyces TaxID=2593676 RepID=UPI0033B364A4